MATALGSALRPNRRGTHENYTALGLARAKTLPTSARAGRFSVENYVVCETACALRHCLAVDPNSPRIVHLNRFVCKAYSAPDAATSNNVTRSPSLASYALLSGPLSRS